MAKHSLILFLLIAFLCSPLNLAKAQDVLEGGRGGNLVIRNGQVTIAREDINIKLHLGFAEVYQDLVIKNGPNPQQVVVGFPYKLGRHNESVSNIQVKVDQVSFLPDSNKETSDDAFTNWKLINLNLLPNQEKTIELTHWQLNSAGLRGFRSFGYGFKNVFQAPAYELNLTLELMDGVDITNFDRSTNLDLDLKLEPSGWKKTENKLTWQWQDITPAFDMNANFYWAGGDLAKTADLSQNLGLHQVRTSSNPEQASFINDGSYLTAWQEKAVGDGIGENLKLEFPNRTISSISILPGLTTSAENFFNFSRPKNMTLAFGDGSTQEISLADEMKVQNYILVKPVETDQITLTINSVYVGLTNPDDTYIAEIELGSNNPDPIKIVDSKSDKIGFWQKISIWFINIFK